MTAPLPTPDEFAEELHNAISGVYGKYRLMVANWVIAIETITENGHQQLDSLVLP